MTTNDPTHTLDTYASAWGPITLEARLATFEKCLDTAFVYTDPNIRTVGYDELAAYMDGFQQQLPGGGFANRDIAYHHDCVLLHWDMTDPTGTVISPGVSSGVITADGRLASMTGFFEQ